MSDRFLDSIMDFCPFAPWMFRPSPECFTLWTFCCLDDLPSTLFTTRMFCPRTVRPLPSLARQPAMFHTPGSSADVSGNYASSSAM